MTEVRSYPKVYNLGHRAIRDLFLGPVAVQEKVDGSQFSFGIIDGALRMRSRNQQIALDNIPALFAPSAQMALRAADNGKLVPDYIYRGEAMKGQRHNTLTYDRVPHGNFVLFDVDVGVEDRLHLRGVLPDIAADLGCEAAPEHFHGEIHDLDEIKALIEQGSFLGGPMEGLVFKNYNRWGIDGKMLMGKYVTDAFREKHADNPDWKPKTKNDILTQIAAVYCHPQRWEKAVQRMRDAGTLTDSPQDIDPLIKSIQADVLEEEGDEIAQMFMEYYAKQLRGSFVRGFPDWYKNRLAESQFDVG